MAASTLWLLAQGAAVSLYLAFVGVIGGTVLALLLNLLAFSRFRLLRWCYFTYIYFVRGTPLLVQALLIFYALPSFGLRLGPLTAGALVLTLYIGAMFAEVFRGGVLAIPRTLWDSSRSLGLAPVPVLRKIVIPLVMR